MDPASLIINEDDADDAEMNELDSMLDVFGSICSLEEIASAYCQGKKDVNRAGEILYEHLEGRSSEISHTLSSKMVITKADGLLQEDRSNCSDFPPNDLKVFKQKKSGISVGTISSVLGKTYTQAPSSLYGVTRTDKPIKLVLEEPLTEETEAEHPDRKDIISDGDMEEFLFAMLGDGFKLSLNVIRETLGNCGYDAKRSMEKLLEGYGKHMEKDKMSDIFDEKSADQTFSSKDTHATAPSSHFDEGRAAYKSSRTEDEKSNLPREVLESLFTVPERSKEPKRKLEWGLNRRRAAGQKLVDKPLDDLPQMHPFDLSTIRSMMKVDVKNVHDEDKYVTLRKAAKFHWETMKSYYEAAMDAFTKGDKSNATYLMEQGQYYKKLAQEANDESAIQIIEERNSEHDAAVPLNLHNLSSKDAVSMLKYHLRKLSGIPSLKYLKVIIDTDAEDTTKGKRRRLVNKLLERESIKWTEESEHSGTILIQLDVLDPNKLQFANKD